MLDEYGLHKLVWDACDERFGDVLVASPADACGRGISLSVRQNGAAADLTGAAVYFVWKHKVTGERWTEPFSTIYADASWVRPSSGITGSQCFYSCSTSLVGG